MSALLHGKGCFNKLKRTTDDEEVKPLFCATFIVKHPCCCCWSALVLTILLSVLGIFVVASSAPADSTTGPLLQEGLTYPFFHPIARKMDALALARDESEEAVLRWDTMNGGRRMLSAQGKEAKAPKWPLASVMKGLGLPEEAHRRLQAGGGPEEDGLQAGQQYQQEEWLTSALFIYKSRDDSGSVFSDESLDELCQLHNTLTSHAEYPDYCLKVAAWVGPDNVRHTYCATGFSPLSLFYGDADYDVDDLDLSILDNPDLEAIYQTAINQQDLLAAYATHGEAAVQQAMYLYSKLFEYLAGTQDNGTMTPSPWFNGTLTRDQASCEPALKKDTAQVLKLFAGIRATPFLSATFGGFPTNYFFDKHFSTTNLKSVYTRGNFDYGGPLAGYDNLIGSSTTTQQENDFSRWWLESKFKDAYVDASALWPTVQPTCLIISMLLQELIMLLVFDAAAAMYPIILVFLIVWLQTRSLFIAIVTLTEQLLSFVCAIFFNACVLQIRWIAFEQFLALYIVLAIGADDVFVFMDAYKQSFYAGEKVNKDLETRMSWVYRRAGLAMLITSLTTCAAFVATAASSPIPTLQNFGIFAAAVIMIDYILVMTFLCSAVVIYHNMFEMKAGLCCACCTCAPVGSAADFALCYAKKNGGCDRICSSGGLATSTAVAHEGGEATNQGKKSLMVRAFEDIFPFNLVIKPKVPRLLSILTFLAILGPAIWGVSQLEPQTSAEQFLPEDHPFQRFFTASNNFMASNNDETCEMQLVWGFVNDDPINLDGVNRLFNPENRGTPKYRADFALTTEAQLALVDDCALLRAAADVQSVYDADTGNTTINVHCFIDAFKEAREFIGAPFPVPDGEVAGALLAWQDRAGLYADDYATGYVLPEAAHPDKYEGDVGWTSNADGSLKLTWVKLRANSMLKARAYLPSNQLRVFYDSWEALKDTLNAGAPAALGDAMQIASLDTSSGGNKWLHMVLQETYVRMALTGVFIGLGIALLVLLLATLNVIMAVLCIITICGALCSVLGCIVLHGWQLGSAESLSMMILTGFAVDYVVHLAHAYMESNSASRLERVHDALRDLGISVFWGMLTSVISAGVLSSLQLQFFSKFGLFFLLTIVWAYLWAIFFLMPLLATIGPEGEAKADAGTEMSGTRAVKEVATDKDGDAQA